MKLTQAQIREILEDNSGGTRWVMDRRNLREQRTTVEIIEDGPEGGDPGGDLERERER